MEGPKPARGWFGEEGSAESRVAHVLRGTACAVGPEAEKHQSLGHPKLH